MVQGAFSLPAWFACACAGGECPASPLSWDTLTHSGSQLRGWRWHGLPRRLSLQQEPSPTWGPWRRQGCESGVSRLCVSSAWLCVPPLSTVPCTGKVSSLQTPQERLQSPLGSLAVPNRGGQCPCVREPQLCAVGLARACGDLPHVSHARAELVGCILTGCETRVPPARAGVMGML